MTSYAPRITHHSSRLFTIQTILLAFLALGLVFSLVTPIFEGPDEMAHFAYVKSLVDGRGFPGGPIVIADDAPAQESGQPPLYYLTAALAVKVLAPDTADFSSLLLRNPAFPALNTGTPNDNKNVFIHAPQPFPYHGATRALRVARLVAVLFGAIAAWATYRLGLEVFPERRAPALLAAATVAFTPQFVFISSSASNDSAAAALCALSLWAAVRVMRLGLTARRGAALGLALGLAALSKASAIGLAPLALLAVSVVDVSGRTRWQARLRGVLLVMLVALIGWGPWALHSLMSFGDVLGTSPHLAMPWARPVPLPVLDTIAQLPAGLVSYWLAFGWGNVVADDWVYAAFNGLALIGAIGAGVWFAKHRARCAIDAAQARLQTASLALMLAWSIVIVAAFVRWVQLLDALLGRLIFPALPGLALLLAVGGLRLTRRVWAVAIFPATLAVVAILALPATLIPAYTPPPILSEAEVAQQPGQTIDVRFENVARLIKVDAPRAPWPHPGDDPAVRVCWEALAQDDRFLMALVQITAQDNRVVASRRTAPGLGAYLTATWQPGMRFCDIVHVRLDETAPAPAVYRVEVALVDQATERRLAAFAPDGTPLSTNFVATTKLAPINYSLPDVANARQDRFGDQIELIGCALDRSTARPGEQVRLRLFWRAVRPPDRAYTVFAHARDAAGKIVTQADGQPQADQYPTSFWDAGEVVIDDRTFDLPLDAIGTLKIVVGLYDPTNGGRLPVIGGRASDEVSLPIELVIDR